MSASRSAAGKMPTSELRKVFLTGASSGIGLETARLLVQHGYEIWGTSRDIARLPQLPHFHPVPMDLENFDSIRKGFTLAQQEAGGFDALINNAGDGAFGPLETMPAEMVRAQFQVLVDAPLELIQLALPKMRERRRGAIVNVTSLAAQFPIPFMAPYSAAKSAFSFSPRDYGWNCRTHPFMWWRFGLATSTRHSMNGQRKAVASVSAEDQRRLKAVWDTQVRNMNAAPKPERVARAILRAITALNPPPVLIVGGFFQARVTPLAARLLPLRLLEWALRQYYRL